ncbi:endonuclease/exonuclease/phosphatase family protein [Micrococcaceae bacterium Sec5.7]
MSRRTLLTAAGATGLAGATSFAGAAHAAPSAAAPKTDALICAAVRSNLHVMSFNIRYDKPGTLPGQADYWPERIPALQALLGLEIPTVLGVQEGLFHQLEAIEGALPKHYKSIGFGRDGGSQGEYSCIFYDSRRLTVLKWDQFWLSDTPEAIGSATWGNYVTRTVTWGTFKDNSTDREMLLINTHFDHQSENARVGSAHAIVDLVKGLAPALPAILTGDFNSAATDSAAYSTLTDRGLFRDTWSAAEVQLTPAYGTLPDYKDPVSGAPRIDWVLTSPDVRVLKAAINTFRLDGRYPSDHAPVQALIRLP